MTASDRPDYIPPGAHWGWVTLAYGHRVGAWVWEGGVLIREQRTYITWRWNPGERRWPDDGQVISGRTWDECKAIWDGRPKVEPKLRASTLTDDTSYVAPAIDWEARRWELFQRLAVGACAIWMNPESECCHDEALRDVRRFCDIALAAYKGRDSSEPSFHGVEWDRTRARLLVRALRLRAEMHAAWDTRHHKLMYRQSRQAADAIEAKYLK